MIRQRTLGQGGLGIVSLYQSENGRQYAVKQMIYQWDITHFERFKREIEIMASLVHKNIVKILSYDILNNNPYYTMDFYKDGSLRDRLMNLQSKGQVYSIKAASSIIYYLADALKHAHNKGIIHRDLKPENILFNNNEPMIADWGIGKFIHRESKVLTFGGLGTKSYCAPEQWNNNISDNRSDIYSLGLIYRELITGSLTGRIENTKVNAIINKMTYQSPADRYQKMEDLLVDIESLNEVPKNDPLSGFITGAIVVVAVFAIAAALAKSFESK